MSDILLLVEDESIFYVLQKLNPKFKEHIKVCNGWSDAMNQVKIHDNVICVCVDYDNNYEEKQRKFKSILSEINKDIVLFFFGLPKDKILNRIFERFVVEDFLFRAFVKDEYHKFMDFDKLASSLGMCRKDVNDIINDIKNFVKFCESKSIKFKRISSKILLQKFFLEKINKRHFKRIFKEMIMCIKEPDEIFRNKEMNKIKNFLSVLGLKLKN